MQLEPHITSALAEFLTRPQAEHQIGAEVLYEIRRGLSPKFFRTCDKHDPAQQAGAQKISATPMIFVASLEQISVALRKNL